MKAVRVLPLVVASFRRNMGADIWHENDMLADSVARGEPGFAENGCWSWTCRAGAGAHVTNSRSRPGSHAAELARLHLGCQQTRHQQTYTGSLGCPTHRQDLPGRQAAGSDGCESCAGARPLTRFCCEPSAVLTRQGRLLAAADERLPTRKQPAAAETRLAFDRDDAYSGCRRASRCLASGTCPLPKCPESPKTAHDASSAAGVAPGPFAPPRCGLRYTS